MTTKTETQKIYIYLPKTRYLVLEMLQAAPKAWTWIYIESNGNWIDDGVIAGIADVCEAIEAAATAAGLELV